MSFSLLRPAILSTVALAAAIALPADPLSKKTEIDFFRDVPSRDLHGLATRSDGRLVAGPQFTDLAGQAPADLLWCLVPSGPNTWLVGTGPTGAIVEFTVDPAKGSYSSHQVAKLDETQIFALGRFPDGEILAGASPRGGLSLVDKGKVVARLGLPVDSVFDILVTNDHTALVATGNPGVIYAVDLKAFAKAGITADKVSGKADLAQKGITVFGEIRDRNVRRLVCLPDGSVIAGSAPKGNLYRFAAKGGAPYVLQENRDAEVTDLLPAPGGFYAAVVYSGGLGEARLIVAPKDQKSAVDQAAAPAPVERFAGRGAIVWFPDNGFPETLSARAGVSFYRLARHGNLVLAAGGEQGDMTGVDVETRKTLTFPGSISSQVSGLAPIPGTDGQFLTLRNNAPGLGLVDFTTPAARSAATRRIDLGTPARIGALRFDRLRDVPEDQVSVSLSTSNTSEETEGWSPWQTLAVRDGGWTGDLPLGRFVRVKLTLAAGAQPTAELDKAQLYYLPQNHRPSLQDFHELTVNYALVPAPDPATPVTTTVSQVLQAIDRDSDRRHASFLGSQIVPSPGTQVVFWTVTDLDGDNLVCTYSIRKDGETKWTDLAVQTKDSYAQFDTSHLAEGVYFTRLKAEEVAPRAKADRLSVTFDTDDLVVDHTPPAILEATAQRDGDNLVITVHGKDQLSLLDSIDVTLNNGVHESTEQPVDGIRDSREETFSIEIPWARAAGATSAEVDLFDAAGNSSTRRVSW